MPTGLLGRGQRDRKAAQDRGWRWSSRGPGGPVKIKAPVAGALALSRFPAQCRLPAGVARGAESRQQLFSRADG